MEAAQRKSLTSTVGSTKVKVTYVQRTTTSLDEEGLKKALGVAKWAKVTKTVVDKRKLEKAIDDGVVDPMVVGQHVSQNLSKPYLRFSTSEVEGDS